MIMIDINLIRENPELVKQNIKKKFKLEKLPLVDKVIKADVEHRKLLAEVQILRHERNEVSQKINQLKKAGKDAKAEIKKGKDIPEQIAKIEEKIKILENNIKEAMFSIPNIIHDSVPLGKDAAENKEIQKIGKQTEFNFPAKNHVELIENLGIADFDISAKTTGKGFFYLKSELAQLNQALIRFSIDFMIKRGYVLVEPPLMIRKEICEGVVDFEFFKTSLIFHGKKDKRITRTCLFIGCHILYHTSLGSLLAAWGTFFIVSHIVGAGCQKKKE